MRVLRRLNSVDIASNNAWEQLDISMNLSSRLDHVALAKFTFHAVFEANYCRWLSMERDGKG